MGLTLVLLIALVLMLVQFLLSEYELTLDNQSSSIESGFEKLWHSSFFSNPFFFMAMLFVLFDLELILILPLVLDSSLSFLSSVNAWILITVITVTLILEWSLYGLKWGV